MFRSRPPRHGNPSPIQGPALAGYKAFHCGPIQAQVAANLSPPPKTAKLGRSVAGQKFPVTQDHIPPSPAPPVATESSTFGATIIT